MTKVDFLPEDYMEKKAQQRTNMICLSLFFLVMAGVAGGVVTTEKRQQAINEREEQVRKNYIKATESLKQMEVLEAKKEQMMQKATVSASLMEKVPRSLLIALITNDLPPGLSLIELDMKSKVVQSAGPAKSKRTRSKKRTKKTEEEKKEAILPEKVETRIEIEGLANSDLQVADLIANLNQSTLFQQVNLLFSEEHTENDLTLRRFRLLVELNPEAKADAEDVEMAREVKVTGM